MKPKTVLLILIVALVITLPYLFIREPGNQEILLQEFTFLGWSVPVSRGLLIALALAAILPAGWFSVVILRLSRRLRKLERAQKSDKPSTMAEGSALLAHGRPQDAVTLIGEEDKPGITLLKGRALLASGEREAAQVVLRKAFEEQGSISAGYLLAEIGGQPDTAVLEEIIARDPTRAARAYHILLEQAEREGRWQEALELVQTLDQKGLPIDRDHARHIRVIAVQNNLELSTRKKIEGFQKVIKEDPDHVAANLYLGEVYAADGAEEKAFRLWERAFESSENPVFLDRIVAALLDQGRPEDAIQVYRRMTARHDTPMLYYQLARLLFRLEILDEALEILEPRKASLGHLPGYGIMTAEIKSRRGRTDEAYADLSEIVAEIPSGPYHCGACGENDEAWRPRCRSCGALGRIGHIAEGIGKGSLEVARAPVW